MNGTHTPRVAPLARLALGAALLSFLAPASFGYTDPELAKLQAEVEQLRRQLYELHQSEPAAADRAPEVVRFTAGWDDGFFLRSADGNYRLNIGGWIQPRYEYQDRSDRDPRATSSFLALPFLSANTGRNEIKTVAFRATRG